MKEKITQKQMGKDLTVFLNSQYKSGVSLVIKEMKFETTARHHFTTTRLTKIKKFDSTKSRPECIAKENTYFLLLTV